MCVREEPTSALEWDNFFRYIANLCLCVTVWGGSWKCPVGHHWQQNRISAQHFFNHLLVVLFSSSTPPPKCRFHNLSGKLTFCVYVQHIHGRSNEGRLTRSSERNNGMGQTAIPNIRSGSCKRSVSVSTTNLGMWGTAAVGCRVLTIHGLELTLGVSKYITREYSREVNMLDRRRRREVGAKAFNIHAITSHTIQTSRAHD